MDATTRTTTANRIGGIAVSADGRRSTFDTARGSGERGSMDDGLTPTAPAEAVEWYLDHRKPELSSSSLENQGYRLERWLEFCEEEAITCMNDVDGRTLHRYRVHRSEKVKPVTLRGELQTLRVFLEFCAAVDAAQPGLRERVQIPKIGTEEETRDELLENDRADTILTNLERFRYASRGHVITTLLWRAGIRLGTLRAIDLGDINLDEGFVQIRHRPNGETPLKNGEAAERMVAIGEKHAEMLSAWVDTNRPDVTDDYGREPLVATEQGRMSKHTVREAVYEATQPCEFGECPHDYDPKDCAFRQYGQRAGCPSSRSPHGLRRGAITHHLRTGVPLEIVSDRMNASDEVLEKHYDQRTERERMELRRDFLEEVE